MTRAGVDVPEAVTTALTGDDVAARLVRKDATLWGPDAESEAAIRLGWLDLPGELPQAGRPARRRCGPS